MSYEDVFRSLKVKGDMYVGGTLTADGLTVGAGAINTTELADSAVTAIKIASDAVITAKILNANVTKAKLETALQPSHVVKYAGTFNTLGGDASETISVPGVLASDIVAVTVKVAGVAPVSVVAAAAGVDGIAVTMSADPAADHVLQYVVFRAA